MIWVRVSTDVSGNQFRYRLRDGGDWRNHEDWIEDDAVPFYLNYDDGVWLLGPVDAAIGDSDE